MMLFSDRLVKYHCDVISLKYRLPFEYPTQPSNPIPCPQWTHTIEATLREEDDPSAAEEVLRERAVRVLDIRAEVER